MTLIQIVLIAFLFLLIGDFFGTFFYHVPEHVFGKFHTLIHHSHSRSFVRYAIARGQPGALVAGFLGIFPYLVSVPLFWHFSALGTIIALILAELHVIWRHLPLETYQTPPAMQKLCQVLCIVTPEWHWQHHEDAMVAYGDVFTFFDRPARIWLHFLLATRKKRAIENQSGLTQFN